WRIADGGETAVRAAAPPGPRKRLQALPRLDGYCAGSPRRRSGSAWGGGAGPEAPVSLTQTWPFSPGIVTRRSVAMTPEEGLKKQIEIYRHRRPHERRRVGFELYELARALARAGVRQQNPQWDEGQVEEEVKRRFRLAAGIP